jgi:hypothetical protein
VQSVASNLVLDSTPPAKHHVQPRDMENEAWQRWRVLDAPDGVGHLLQSVHNGKYLTAGEDTENGGCPWFEARHGGASQRGSLQPRTVTRIRIR